MRGRKKPSNELTESAKPIAHLEALERQRKRMEHRLRDSEVRYRRLFETAQDGILILDAETGQIIDVNPFLINMLGYSKNEFLGKRLWEIGPFKDTEAAKGAFSALQKTGYVRYENLPLETKDGQQVAVEFVSNVYQVNDQNVIQCNIRDITAHSKAEHDLRERIKELQCLYSISRVLEKPELSLDETLQEIVNLLPPAMQYPHITCARILFREKSFVTKNYETAERILSSDIKIHGTKAGAVEISYLERMPDIDAAPFLKEERLLIDAIAERLGKVIERMQAEKAVQAERNQLISILDAMEDGVYIVNQNYDIEYANPAIKKEFGPAERRKCYTYLNDREEVCPWCKNKEVLTGKTIRWEWRSFKNNKIYDLIDAPLRNPDGTNSKLAIFRDITEGKKAEERLLQSEDLLKQSQEIAHLGSWELDLVNNCLTWSDEVYRIFGLKPQEFGATYEAFLEAVYPDDRSAVDAAYSSSIGEGKDSYEIEHRIMRKSTGEIRYVHEKCQHIRDENGKIIRSIGMVHDITDRRQAEEALRQSERLYHSLFENMLDGFAYCQMLFDHGRPQDFAYLGINSAFEKLTGLKDVVGKRVTEIIPGLKQSIPELFEIYGRVALTGAPERFELYLEQLSRWFLISVYSPEKGYFVAVFENITERKQAEQALKESERLLHDSEQRLHLAQEAANAGTWEWDLRTNKNYWSEEIWKLYGLAPHSCEPSYDAWAQAIHPDDRPKVEKAVQEAANNGTRLSTEWRVAGRPGNERWLMSIGQPVLDTSGKVTRYIGIVIDITERRKAEQLKDEFIGLVSHELRTPMTVITGSLQTAMSEGISLEDKETLLQNAVEGAGSLSAILENLLELSRYQAGRLQIHRETVNIPDIAKSVIEKLKTPSEGHRFQVDFSHDVPQVEADPVRVERILYNLLENATKYSPEKSVIKVFAREKNGQVITGVADKGIGVSPEDRTRLFELFERLEKSPRTQGLGLGLVVCKRLVEAQGGSIWVESEPGKGSTFYFALPMNRKRA